MALAAGLALLVLAFGTAVADPLVRRVQVALPGLGETLTVLLISDVHVAAPDMPPARLERIVAQANALRPDLILIAGDLVSDKRTATRYYSMAEAVAPLTGLRARLGTHAVLGNHDHWRGRGEAKAALAAAGIGLLINDAVRAGPLVLGGLDDAFTDHDDLPLTLRRMRALGGPGLIFSHSPDPFPQLPPDIPLMLAGHTHCGQIRLPFVGAFATMSDHGDRYACGLVREQGRTLVVGAGLGTSILPLRLGARPDLWLVTLVPG